MAWGSIRLLEFVRLGSSSGISAVTFTAVLAAAMLSLIRYSVGRAVRISMRPLYGENPPLSTLSWYGPKGKLRAVSKPASSVTRLRWSCAASLDERDGGLDSEAVRIRDFEAEFSRVALRKERQSQQNDSEVKQPTQGYGRGDAS